MMTHAIEKKRAPGGGGAMEAVVFDYFDGDCVGAGGTVATSARFSASEANPGLINGSVVD